MWLQLNRFQVSATTGLQVVFCALALSLTACGFHPMYGSHAHNAIGNQSLQGNIQIAPVSGDEARYSQILKNALEDRFNPQGITNSKPDYTLTVTLKRSLVPAVVRSDGTILRYDLKFDTNYTLKDNRSSAPPYSGNVRRINSYNVVPNANFATYEAEQNLNERMLTEIAEDYVLRISSYLAGKE